MKNILKKRNLDLAKMLYTQKKYEQAERVVMNHIETAEAKHLMGKICTKTGRMEDAKFWFKSAMDTNKRNVKKWVAPRMELAKIYYVEGNWELAKKEFDTCLRREPQNGLLKVTLAKCYANRGEKEEARQLLVKAMNVEKTEKVLKEALVVYSDMEDYESMYEICEKLSAGDCVKSNEYRVIECMARAYFNLGKYDKALNVFRDKKDDQVARAIFGTYRQKIYCKIHNDEELAKVYQEILENLEAAYSEEARMQHIRKHLKDDKTRKIHGVFTMDIKEVWEKVKKTKKEKQSFDNCDVYCVKIEGCGYSGGKEGDGHTLDYVTLITFPGSEVPIALYPSDKIEIRNKPFNPGGENR